LGQLFLLRLSKKQKPKKVQSRLSFARQAGLRDVTAAVVGLLFAAFYDPLWTTEILTKLDYAFAAAALPAM